MIRKGKTHKGQVGFSGRIQDLQAVNAWVQCFMHLAHGPVEGEERYRNVRLIDALDLWSSANAPSTTRGQTGER